jgi:nucleotide-binding universal stress UspA family protein
MSPDDQEHQPVIVVGIDGSAASIEALRWAGRAAHADGAKIEAVTSWEYPISYGMSGAFGDWDPAADAQQVVDDAIAAAFPGQQPDGIHTTIREGHPAEVLITASRDAEMLVVGSRGRGGFIGLLLGSVSAYCAEHAPCPVVVIRPNPGRRPDDTKP